MGKTALEDTRISARLKLAALWTSVMFCYVYGDYFELYVPGKLQDMLNGEMTLGTRYGTFLIVFVITQLKQH